MSSTNSTIIKSFVWKLLERCSVQVVSFVVTIILARLLLPEEYGIIALITIFIALAEVIADGGFNTALIQKKNADNTDFSTIFFFSLFVSVLLYVVLYISAPYIAKFYGMADLVKVIRILSTSLFLYSFNSVQRAYISKYMLFKKLFYSSLGAILLSGCIGIVMAYAGFGVWSLVTQTLLNQLFTILIMWFTVKWRPNFIFSRTSFKELFDFGWKIFCTNFIITLFIRVRALVVGKIFSPSTLAYYEKGDQFPGLIMNNVCGSIQSVIFPAFSEVQDDRTRVRAMMRKAINASCLVMFPLMIGLMVSAKPLVVLLLTEKWIEVVPFMQVLCIANFFRPITIPNQQAITALGYSGITLKLEIIKKVVDISILAVSCYFGAIAIAWGVVIFNFLCIFINLFPNIKLLDYKLQEQIIDVMPILLISLLMGGSVYWVQYMQWTPFVQLAVIFLIGTSVYCALCRVMKIESYMFFMNIIKQKRL